MRSAIAGRAMEFQPRKRKPRRGDRPTRQAQYWRLQRRMDWVNDGIGIAVRGEQQLKAFTLEADEFLGDERR